LVVVSRSRQSWGGGERGPATHLAVPPVPEGVEPALPAERGGVALAAGHARHGDGGEAGDGVRGRGLQDAAAEPQLAVGREAEGVETTGDGEGDGVAAATRDAGRPLGQADPLRGVAVVPGGPGQAELAAVRLAPGPQLAGGGHQGRVVVAGRHPAHRVGEGQQVGRVDRLLGLRAEPQLALSVAAPHPHLHGGGGGPEERTWPASVRARVCAVPALSWWTRPSRPARGPAPSAAHLPP
jgi:hypothetical protein